MTKKEKLIKRLRGLKQNKNLTEEQLVKLAEEKLEEKELKKAFSGLISSEIKQAVEIYKEYLSQNLFESYAEKSKLIGMVYKKMLRQRMQKFMEDEYTKTNAKGEQVGAIPLGIAQKMLDLDSSIAEDERVLGLLKEKETDSFSSVWNELKTKAKEYYNTHAGEIYYKCPYCLQLSRQIMKLDGYDIKKASFFRGTTLYNKPLLKAYHEKKLTIEEVAKILDVNHKYVTLIYEQIFLKDLKNDS